MVRNKPSPAVKPGRKDNTMKRQTIKARVEQIIEERRKQLQKEITGWKRKLRDTEEYWGMNGPYRRQEEALERREKELKELEEYARQLGKYIPFKEVSMYGLYCRDCGNVTLSLNISGEWTECPSCKKMIYDNNPQRKTFKIEDDGQYWLRAFYEVQEK